MMMVVSTPDYIAVRSNSRNTRESSVSPSCRSSVHVPHLNTPPRPGPRSSVYDSPMLTPSPLRGRPLFPHDRRSSATDEDDDSDADIFFQSPFQSPPQRYHAHPAKPLPIGTDDDEGGIFLSAAPQPLSAFTFPSSSSQPLRTPVKQVHRTPSHSHLSIKHLNTQSHAASAFALGGTKRKESGPDFSTPLRQRIVTPLGISAQNAGDTGNVSFDRLAPLPAPRFTTPQHPQSKAETEVHLKKHTETMTKLRICDLDDSDDEEGRRGPLFSRSGAGNSRSTGYGADNAKSYTKAMAGAKGNGKPKSTSLGRSLGASLLAIAQNKTKKCKGKGGEVAEAISPGGHVTKRRARSRPVSQELLESVVSWTPTSPSPGQVDPRSNAKVDRVTGPVRGPISFPSLTQMRTRALSNSSSHSSLSSPSPSLSLSNSEAGSPLPKRRVSVTHNHSHIHRQPHERAQTFPQATATPIHAEIPVPVRAPMSRLVSSATLFFGPAIPSATANPSSNSTTRDRSRSRTRTRTTNVRSPKPNVKLSSSTNSNALAVNTNVSRPGMMTRPSLHNRHSYAGPGSASGGKRSKSGNLPWARGLRASPGSESPSPRSCLSDGETHILDNDNDEDMFFDGPKDSSFVFSVTEGTPSPRKHSVGGGVGLKKKYKPRDSGIGLSDDEGSSTNMGTGYKTGMWTGGTMGASGSLGGMRDFLSVMPSASNSVNSLYSDVDQELVTPGYGPGERSGWPEAFVVADGDVNGNGHGGVGEGGVDLDVDTFILRTLAAATGPNSRRGSEGGGQGHGLMKKIPGTPVKKIKTSHLGGLGDGGRPWQSAVATKVGGLGFDLDLGLQGGKGGKIPRKSMPAAFPWRGRGTGDGGGDTESEGEEDSPSFRREARYEGLGIGKPKAKVMSSGGNNDGGGGAFSKSRWLMRRSSSGMFSSGSDLSVGTPTKLQAEWNAHPSRAPTQFSPAKNMINFATGRSVSGSSSSSGATLHSPSLRRQLPISGTLSTQTQTQVHRRPHASPIQQQPERDQERHHSGRFERDFVEDDEVGSGEFGKVMKVRYKIGREGEVFAVKKSKRFEGVRHRLRLREEVDILQHLSQAAASGADGQHPNVLAYIDSWEQDEALYIQTELCELGNFARFLWEYGRVFPRLDEARVWKIFVDLSNGLQFIHSSGVIHLDLKPANIFVTGDGRFKIGDFGMASLWPRPNYKAVGSFEGGGAFEREGDKVYLAPEVLQGNYGKEADIFSLGITMLETASNIVVPDQGDAWHQLRQEDFSQIDLDGSPELLALIKSMMRTDPALRVDMQTICAHPVIFRAQSAMERTFAQAKSNGTSLFAASPLAGVPDTFLEAILDRSTVLISDDGAMDLSP